MSDTKMDKGTKVVSEDVAKVGLMYQMPAKQNFVQHRSLKKIYAQRQEYKPNDYMVFEISSGQDYINGATSFLTFDLQAEGKDMAGAAMESITFGAGGGSAMNVINTAILQNGEELERIDNVNLLDYIRTKYACSEQHLKTTGSASYYAPSGTTPHDFDTAPGTTKVAIPLSKIFGIFNTKKLVPSQIIAGARMQLKLETAAKAFVFAASDPVASAVNPATISYTVTNPTLVFDSHLLKDKVSGHLQRQAAKGLTHTYLTYSHTGLTLESKQTRLSANVSKPVSMLANAFAKARTEKSQADEIVGDSFASIAYPLTDPTTTRWRLGSSNYPDVPTENSLEQYMLTQYTFGKLAKCEMGNAVSYSRFQTDQAVAAMSFERLGDDKLSGLYVNTGGRSLVFDYTKTDNNAVLAVDVFSGHIVTCTGFADGSINVQH